MDGAHHHTVTLDGSNRGSGSNGRLAGLSTVQGRSTGDVGLQGSSEVGVRMLNVVLQTVEVLVALATVEEGATVGFDVRLVVLVRSGDGAVAVLVMVLETVGVLVGLVAAIDRAAVRLVGAGGTRPTNALHHADNLLALLEELLGSKEV